MAISFRIARSLAAKPLRRYLSEANGARLASSQGATIMAFSNPIAIQIAGLSTELTMLAVAIVLGMFQLLIAARTGNSQRGLKWNVGPRDAPAPPVSKVAGRLERAFRNFLETFPFFA